MKEYKPIPCKECGQLFTPTNPSQHYCKRDHYRHCPICGKEYLVKRNCLNDPPRACLGACSKELRRRTNLKRYGVEDAGNSDASKAKRKATNLARYGVDNPAKASQFKQKASETFQRKYGVNWASQSDIVKQKTHETWLAKSPEELADITEKRIATNLKKYGVEWVRQTPENINKVKQTNLQKYGVECPLQLPEIKQHTQEVLTEKYGEHPFSSEKMLERRRQGSLKKYGVTHPFKSEEVKKRAQNNLFNKYGVYNIRNIPGVEEKIQKTNLERYGSKTYLTSEMLLREMMREGSKYEEYCKFKDNPRNYISTYFDGKPNVYEVAEHLGVTDTSIYTWLDKFNCRDCISFSGSSIEREIIGFLKENVPSIQIKHNDKTAIKPLELDIYLPEYNIAIECNPTCTHNSTFVDPWGGDPKHYKYHQHKSLECERNGIFLFHVFGYEWTNKKDIIKSMILNLLHKISRKIYARNTYVCDIPALECNKFLLENHRQGYTNASIRIGLREKSTNELVSVMTFNHIRNTIGTTNSKKLEWELSRFCNLKNTSVVGGASKLFKYFQNVHKPTSVLSFSDVAHTLGQLYQILGFSKISISDPGYVWVNSLNDHYYSRVQCQKKNLHRIFKDEVIDLSKTEKQIMSDHGYCQVFDSGVIRWEWESTEINF